MIRVTTMALFCLALAAPAPALDLSLPNATLTAEETTPAGSARLPDAPWTQGGTPTLAEGAIRKYALRLPGSARTTLQLLSPLREELREQGYEDVFACADDACGGFDFRFQLDILGEPAMHVDLGDFRYLLMRNDEEEPHSVSIVTSRSRSAGFVHITEVSTAYTPPPERDTSPATPGLPSLTRDFIDTLTSSGHAVLDDLDFGTGSSELGPGPHQSLTKLADWLLGNPEARVVLVGHTDSVGALDTNTALSRRRAAAVVRRMTDSLGVNPAQVEAAGAGYLAPRASNLTENGRALNRRVEVVLLSIE